MQLAISVMVLLSVLIALATSSPAGVPILSQLIDVSPVMRSPTMGQLVRLPIRQLIGEQATDKKRSQQDNGRKYGVPKVSGSRDDLPATTELPTTATSEDVGVEQVAKEEVNLQAEASAKFDEMGVYYIYHPDGLLQRVSYATRSQDMGYTARLSYKDVEPIKDPIYTYDPKTLAFTQIVF